MTFVLTVMTTPRTCRRLRVHGGSRSITGIERRRKWSAQEKVAIVAESLAEGPVVSKVARRHALSPQQLFAWRSWLRDAVKGSAPSSDATPAFVPAIVEDAPRSSAAPALPAAVVAMGSAGVDPAPIEIALGGVICCAVGRKCILVAP